jgi:hypothetical protein
MSAPHFLERLFRPSLVEESGNPVPFIWVGDDHWSVCIDPNSSRVYAMMWNDGCGKFYPTVYVSLVGACRILSREPVVSLGMRSFPRCALELLRSKFSSMTEAQEALQELLVELRVI